MNKILIEAKNIRKTFKDIKAVDNISLQIYENEFVALLGPNGAGKTTLVEMIEGIQKPSSGEIRINGSLWRNQYEKLHQLIGLSLQETRFMDKISVNETLNLFASFYKQGHKRVVQILSLINLQDKKKARVNKLSGGQRQRLAIGIALLNRPKLLLLDEPTTGLDPNARREIWEILIKLKKDFKTSMILTTHYMEEAEYLCDRIIIMHKGSILMQGTLDELMAKNNLKSKLEFTLRDKRQASTFEHFDINWNKNEKGGNFPLEDVQKDLLKFSHYIEQNNIKIKTMEAKAPTLDDLFVVLTGERLNINQNS